MRLLKKLRRSWKFDRGELACPDGRLPSSWYRELANADVNKAFWKNLLDVNSKSHKCHGCDRHIPATDAKQFETYVRSFILGLNDKALIIRSIAILADYRPKA